MPLTVPPPNHNRAPRLDALRGLAVLWMAVFHFFFDLNHLGLLQPRENFYADPFWTVQRSAIVSLFMFCAGLGQALAWQAGQSGLRFWRRWGQVAGCAVLVSLGSAFMFPRSWISFGVLHGLAVMLLLTRLIAPLALRPLTLVLLGACAVTAPLWLAHPFFNHPALQWLGLVTRKPVTEDFVPVLPWLGVMWWGLACGQLLLQRAPRMLARSLPPGLGALATLGRWSLSFYMLHQPVLFGLILTAQALFLR